MTTITIKVNTRLNEGKHLISLINSLSKNGTVSIEKTKSRKNESQYNPEFVAEIQKSRNSIGEPVKTADLWK